MTKPPENSQKDIDPDRIEQPWSRSAKEVLHDLHTQPEKGLDAAEARRRRDQHGSNRLREYKSRPWWRILLEQFKSVVIIILALAAGISFAFGDIPEAIALLAVVVINSGIGFVSEWRATRSMEALRKIGRPKVRLRRGGKEKQCPSDSIVPGDITILEAGDVSPADMRLIEANGLSVDESPLTGESVAVAKQTESVQADTPLAERNCMLFKGTTITEGSAEAVVTATGMDTELGRISQLTEDVNEEITPLEQRLESLGRRMAILALSAAAVIAVAGFFAGHPLRLILATAVALGVAAVPEGLPIVANLALARGMWVMSRRNALINRLPAVETLGATDVIFTDKTGTLTENRMQLKKIITSNQKEEFVFASDDEKQEEAKPKLGPLMQRIVEVGVLCCNASLSEEGAQEDAQGDPTEIALLRAGKRTGMTRPTLLKEKPETREESFDPEVMMMATFHRVEKGLEEAVKGAPGAVLDVCTSMATDQNDQKSFTQEDRDHWNQRSEELAGQGLRVLAMADRVVEDDTVEPYENLRFLGLVGLYDPPRDDVKELIDSCRDAGIRVVMVTGDQPNTAKAIAQQVDIVEDDQVKVLHSRSFPEPETLSEEQRDEILHTQIFARFSPKQKLDLVEVFQSAGHTVAMTGDGINDSPALKKADIGVAMGRRGTDAAREASDMILQDDAFSSIVAAIRQGRVIFGNIRTSVMFMLCTNIAEVLAVAAASISGVPLPLRPLQILYLNMLTDVFPALALGVGKGGPNVMRRAPRRQGESILTLHHWLGIGGGGVGIAVCVLMGLGVGRLWLDLTVPQAITVSFLTLGFAKLWFVYNLRDLNSHWIFNEILRNPWIGAVIVFCAGLLFAAVYVPGLSTLLKTRRIGTMGWLTVLVLSLLPSVIGQMIHSIRFVLGNVRE